MMHASYLRRMLSFWERESFLSYDLIVIGAGIVGLSTALSYRERHPQKRILVLERGIFPSGASTKNAGFACFGSAAEIASDIHIQGLEAALSVVEMRLRGLRKLRQRVGDAGLGYEERGGGELVLEGSDFDLGLPEQLNASLFPLFGQPVFEWDDAALDGFGFERKRVKHFIRNRVEGQIDTGKTLQSLLQLARIQHVEVLTGVMAEKPYWSGTDWRVACKNQPISFHSEAVAICTNAFTPELFPDWDVRPGRGQVLITQPIPDLPFRGIFHYEEGYFYFRNVGNRVLLGGGRNLDVEGETSSELALTDLIQNRLEKDLREMILPGRKEVEIDMRWAGIMAFGDEKGPLIRKVADGLVAGVRMNGMGVAIGTEVGERLAALLEA